MKMFHPITTKDRIFVQNVILSWSFENVRDSNNSIDVDGNVETVANGYYSFDDLKTLLKKLGIVIKKLANNKIELTSTKDVNLKSFGELLGFSKDESLVKTTKHVSSKKLNLTNDLNKILIYSDVVDMRKNLHFYEDKCYFSELLLEIPIDTSQNLNGVLTKYDFMHYSVPCLEKLRKHELNFQVVSGGDVDDYEINLSLIL